MSSFHELVIKLGRTLAADSILRTCQNGQFSGIRVQVWSNPCYWNGLERKRRRSKWQNRADDCGKPCSFLQSPRSASCLVVGRISPNRPVCSSV